MTDVPENDSEAQGQSPEAGVAPEYPGKRLKEVREANHLSREEVGRHLHLDVQLIGALEENDQDKLPAQAYVCGYLRSYARLLKLPEDEIVDAYNQGREMEAALIPENIDFTPSAARAGNLGKTLLFIIVVLVIVAVVIWRDQFPFFSSNEQAAESAGEVEQSVTLPGAEAPQPPPDAVPLSPPPLQELRSGDNPNAEEATPADGGDGASTQGDAGTQNETVTEDNPEVASAESPSSETSAATKNKVEPASETAPSAPPKDEVKKPASETAPSAAPSSAAETAGPLQLAFSANSWTEVRDATGKVLVYRLVKKGETLNIEGRPPFKVLLGNAPEVQVQYQGKPFDVAPYLRDEIAYFAVGKAKTEN
jgi:cytoskeleton protein RodZ